MAYTNKGIDLALEMTCKPLSTNFTNISLAWTNLRVEVGQVFTKKKLILNRLNGHFEGGTVNALLGVSGAGKTTLLKVLSGRYKNKVHSESKIFVPSTNLHPSSVFIEQDVHEAIHDCLSVWQILRYAFLFKNSSKDFHLINDHIRGTMKDLLLPNELLDQRFDKCSGGEQKRIAICCELMSLAKFDFLFLDEPTTGLDSTAAFEVVQCLKSLNRKYSTSMTIVASIHSPNQKTLHLFDKILVLAKGGVCLYSGAPNGLESYLELQLGADRKEVKNVGYKQPPIEKLIKIACNDLTHSDVSTLAKTCHTTEFTTISQSASSLSSLSRGLPNSQKHFHFQDFMHHVHRQFHITYVGNFKLFFIQLIIYIANSTFLSTVFCSDMVFPSGCYSVANETEVGSCQLEIAQNSLITENINFLSVNISIISFCIVSTNAAFFIPIAKIFFNEHQNKCYSLGVFFFSTTFTSIFELFIIAFTISVSSYFFSGQNLVDIDLNMTFIRFVHYLTVLYLKSLYVQTIGQIVSICLVKSNVMAMVTANLIFVVLDTFNDYFVKVDELKIPALVWISNLVGFNYINRYMIYTFYGIGRCNFNSGEVSSVFEKYLVDPDKIGFYITRIITNILALKLLFFAVIFFKFNFFKIVSKILTFESRTENVYLEPKLLFVKSQHLNNNNNIDLVTNSQMNKSKHELSFRKFSQNKILIGFRNITLHKSNSIYEHHHSADSNSIILNNLNGHFCFGTLNALMGFTGSGKTSLLRVLNGQCKARLNPKSQIHLSRFTKISTCFIAQEVSHHLMPGLTAMQSLIFASRFKNQANENVDHKKVAETILAELNLTHVSDTKVENCSGGEKKRLALALELTSVEMPNLICIDEPTSGLDSSSADMVIDCLRKLAHSRNLTIITSIHQPSTSILHSFDQIYVLAHGGVCIYSGPPNLIADHLKSVQCTHETDTREAQFPIEHLISYSCKSSQSKSVQKLMRAANESVHQFAAAELFADTQLAPEGVCPNRTRFLFTSVRLLTFRYLCHIYGYLWKELLGFTLVLAYYANNLHTFWPSSIATVSGCLSLEDDLTQNCWHNNSSKSSHLVEKAMEDNVKYSLFMCILFLLFIVLQASLTLYREIKYLLAESQNGWYCPLAYYLSKCTLELIIILPILALYVHICDIYSALHPGIYWHLLFILTLTVTATQAFSHMLVLLSRGNFQVSTIITLLAFELFLLLSNFFISLHRLHYFYQFLANLNTPRFALEASLLLQFGFGRCDEATQVQPILYWMNLSDDHYSASIQMIILHIILYRLAAFCMLNWNVRRRKSSKKAEEYKRNVNVQENGKITHFFGQSQLTLRHFEV